MILAAAIPALLAAQVQVTIGAGGQKPDTVRQRGAQVEAVMEEVRDDTTGRNRPVRRVEVTARHLATAFRDSVARDLLLRARRARLAQDTALMSYDARAYERVSVGLGIRAVGRERLAFRHEDAARVRWHRDRGAWVEVTGSRSAAPIANNGDRDAEAEVSTLAPIPYYPGRDNLWVGSGLARAEVDDREFVHPLAIGAEAYYTYETGDSLTMTLPDGKTFLLRELRIVAREPRWNVTVGSFWFDVRSAHLVRAAYRISTPMDIWAVSRAENTRARPDSQPGAGGRGRRQNGDGPPAWARPLLSPMRADVSGITIEYGLYNQQFWLPRAQSAEGFAQVSFMRIPMTFEQRFQYESVNAIDSLPSMPPVTRSPVIALRDSLRRAGVDSVRRDSLVRAARRARIAEIAAERGRACEATGSYTSYRTRYEGTLRVAVQVPCDSALLANSPDLPPSIFDPSDDLLGAGDRDMLMKALGFGLQPGWGPQLPTLDYGLSHTRYNRVEGFSTAIAATSALGRGFSLAAELRGSAADRQVNGAIGVSRSNGRTNVRLQAYRRLAASDDWGSPLSFGASVAALLYARDEGAYYRARGVELTRAPVGAGNIDLRFFAEEQWGDSVRTRWSLFGGGDDSRFIANPLADRVTVAGASARLRRQWGLNPDALRVMTDFRLEAAGGDSIYARGLGDLVVSGRLGAAAAAVTFSGGGSAGGVPIQRRFYLGGSNSIRGQTALTAAGDAFWMTRVELGTRNTAARTVVFGDLGWAGDRTLWRTIGRPLSGAGIGWSFLDGLIRADIARGLWPAKQWRVDLRLDAKF